MWCRNDSSSFKQKASASQAAQLPVRQLVGPVGLAKPLQGEVQRHGRKQRLVLQLAAVCEGRRPCVLVYADHRAAAA